MDAKGKVDQKIVDEVLQGLYFKHDVPKTTGSGTFGDRMAEDICDKMIASKSNALVYSASGDLTHHQTAHPIAF